MKIINQISCCLFSEFFIIPPFDYNENKISRVVNLNSKKIFSEIYRSWGFAGRSLSKKTFLLVFERFCSYQKRCHCINTGESNESVFFCAKACINARRLNKELNRDLVGLQQKLLY